MIVAPLRSVRRFLGQPFISNDGVTAIGPEAAVLCSEAQPHGIARDGKRQPCQHHKKTKLQQPAVFLDSDASHQNILLPTYERELQ